MFHRHLHIAPVDRSPLALVLQLIPKYSQIAINRTFLKMNLLNLSCCVVTDNNWPVTYIESLQLVWAFYRSADYLGSYYGVPIAVFLQGLLNMERVAGISLISAITVSRHTGLGH